MNKQNIENKLRTWFDNMTKKYSWLRIKFEFNNSRGVYMVSFSPVSQIELSDEFNQDAMRFSDEMYAEYDLEAPLFTDEEELFRLSSVAETIPAPTFVSLGKPFTTIIKVNTQHDDRLWSTALKTNTVNTVNDYRQSQTDDYAFAA